MTLFAAKPYFHDLLQELVNTVHTRSLKGSLKVELSTLKLDSSENLEENRKNFETLCQSFLDSIYASSDSLPA